MLALVPLKDFSEVKQRLGSLLSTIERRTLFRAMVEDLLSSLSNHPKIDKVVIVSDDPTARFLAQQIGAEVLSEQSLNAKGMNGVIQAAYQQLSQQLNRSQSQQEIMIIHGDLPLVTRANLSELITHHQQAQIPTVTIATDEHAQGSNCVIIKAGSNFSFAYGEYSLQRHQQEAQRNNFDFQQCQIHGLACDIDYPDDLLNVIKNTDQHCAVNTKNYLAVSGINERFETTTINQIRNSQLSTEAVALEQVG